MRPLPFTHRAALVLRIVLMRIVFHGLCFRSQPVLQAGGLDVALPGMVSIYSLILPLNLLLDPGDLEEHRHAHQHLALKF
jgi:hypothetical protein